MHCSILTLPLAGSVLALGVSAQGALVAQYRASDFTGGAVPTWTDNAGSYDFQSLNPNTDTHPELVAGVTPLGQSAVRFSSDGGVGDYMELGGGGINTAAFTSAPDFAMFLVLDYNDSSFGHVLSGANGAATYRLNGTGTGIPDTASLTSLNTAAVGDSNPGIGTDWAVLAVTYSGGNWAFYKNGIALGSGTSGVTFSQGVSLLGTSQGLAFSFYGDIAEVRLYDNVGTVNVSSISSELANTYLIPEPASAGLAAVGGLMMLRRRRGRLGQTALLLHPEPVGVARVPRHRLAHAARRRLPPRHAPRVPHRLGHDHRRPQLQRRHGLPR